MWETERKDKILATNPLNARSDFSLYLFVVIGEFVDFNKIFVPVTSGVFKILSSVGGF
jgi:hypothetical protein